MFRYPKQLQLPDQEVTYVNSAEEFLPYYDQVFTQDFLDTLENIDPADFTQEGPAIGWGEGAVWARGLRRGGDHGLCVCLPGGPLSCLLRGK